MSQSKQQQQQTEPVVSTTLLQSSAEKKYSTETNKVKAKTMIDLLSFDFSQNVANYREIGFSPASSAQSDSCSNSNHTSESSSISTVNSKQTQVKPHNDLDSILNELTFWFRLKSQDR